MSKGFKIFLHIVLPIIVGSSIYLLFRPKNINVFYYIKTGHLEPIIDLFRSNAKPFKPLDWIVFCLPGGLWLYSYVYAVGMSWKNEVNRKNLFWYLLPLILAVSSEFGQYFKIIRGTFDWLDIGSYVLATVFAMLLLAPKINFNGTHNI